MEVLIIVLICLGAIILISLTEQTEEIGENSNEPEKVIEQNEQTRNEQEKIIEQNKQSKNELKENNYFNVSKKVGNYIYFDEFNKKWTIPQGLFKKKINNSMIHSYNDITDFELIEDGNTISKGGIGRAVVGGALFGDIGAIVGGVTGHKYKQTCTRLQIKITLNDINSPIEYINFIDTETKKDSIIYKSAFTFAQEIISILQIICNSSGTTKQTKEISDFDIDEIRKYKELLDMGAITQEEFEMKKKELLNL